MAVYDPNSNMWNKYAHTPDWRAFLIGGPRNNLSSDDEEIIDIMCELETYALESKLRTFVRKWQKKNQLSDSLVKQIMKHLDIPRY